LSGLVVFVYQQDCHVNATFSRILATHWHHNGHHLRFYFTAMLSAYIHVVSSVSNFLSPTSESSMSAIQLEGLF
jgi:hypothetical protein